MAKLPPGPGHRLGFKFIEHFKADPLGLMAQIQKTYGDIVFARMGPFRGYFFFHPDQIREILVTKAKSLPKQKRQVEIMRQWDGNGLLLSEGEFWQRQRRLVQPAFNPKRFGAYGAVMTNRARRRAERIAPGSVTEIGSEMTALTLEIISETLFGAEVSGETSELESAVSILSEVAVEEMKSLFRWPLWMPLPAVKSKRWAMEKLDSTIRGFINERRRTGEDKGDLLSMLLLATDSEGASGKMTDEQARDEAMVLFLAGHDTTAAALTWLFYVLGKYPAIQDRVFKELPAGELTAADIPKMKYLEAVIKETLRLYPPAVGIFGRQVAEPITLGSYELRSNDFVYAFSYVIHRDPRWFPDPESFEPERFLPPRETQIPAFAYFPFGGGSRVCIGMTFAMMEIALVAGTFLKKFRVELADTSPPELNVLLSLRPKNGIRIRLQSR